jgi:hypothetical protein
MINIGISLAYAVLLRCYLTLSKYTVDLSLAYVLLLRSYLMLQPTGRSCMPLREHNLDPIISVAYGISDAAI